MGVPLFAPLSALKPEINPRPASKARTSSRTRFRAFSPVFLVLLAGFVTYQSVILVRVIRLRKRNPDITAFMDLRRQEMSSQGRTFQPQILWVPYDSISPNLRDAIVASEDPRFWRHPGFDPKAIWKAGKVDWQARGLLRGGSTLDPQLAKNLFFSPAKNPLRKVQEIIVAVEMETFLSKKRIIELYLNVIEWGYGIYGVEAASRHYFGKSAASLSTEQAAYLTAIIPGPRGQYNPLEYPERVASRASEIMKGLLREIR